MLRVLSTVFLLSASAASVAAGPLDPLVAQHVDADVAAILQRTGAPSATIAVAEHGRIIYSKAYGLAERETRSAATVDTHYEIGSITKQFTAAAMLQLQAAGKLHLDGQALGLPAAGAPCR